MASFRSIGFVLAVLLSFGLGVRAWFDWQEFERLRAGYVAKAQEIGLQDAAFLSELRSAPTAEVAALRLSRAIVGAELEGTKPTDPDLRLLRLNLANDLAREILEHSPTSWEGAMFAGAATYLAWSTSEDPRLFQAYRDWEAPLLLALELAPNKREPVGFLAAAYLELWPALSPNKQEQARSLLVEAFADKQSFERLILPWLELQADDENAFDIVPDRPAAWSFLRGHFLQTTDWAAVCATHVGRISSLRGHLESTIESGELRVAGGELLEGRRLLLGAASDTPPGGDLLDLFERALLAAPVGPMLPERVPALRSWLTWCVDRQSQRSWQPETPRCSTAAIRALVFNSLDPDSKTQDAVLSARADLAVGDEAQAERSERAHEARFDFAWSQYWIDKAARSLDTLHARRDAASATAATTATDRAAAALDAVAVPLAQDPTYAWLRQRVAESSGSTPTDTLKTVPSSGTALGLFDQLAARPITSQDWQHGSGWSEIRLAAKTDANRLAVAFEGVPTIGTAYLVQLDGEEVACWTIDRPGEYVARVRAARGPHRVELRRLGGGGGAVPTSARLANWAEQPTTEAVTPAASP